MRWSICLLLVAMTLAAETRAATAQQTGSYPWCARDDRLPGSLPSCYFTSKEACMATLSGVGGTCLQNPNSLRTLAPQSPSAARPPGRR